jgi:hypothetical protein
MPTFIKKNPVELSGDLKANKIVSKLLLKQNVVSGFLGPTKKNSEYFDKVSSLLEDLEVQIEIYFPSIYQSFGVDFTIDPYNPTKIYNLLERAKRAVLKSSFSLKQQPQDDVDKIEKILNALKVVQGKVNDGLVYIERRKRDLTDPDLAVPTEIILDVFKDQLEEIIPPIESQVDIYSNVAQPMTGGCHCEYNLDEPLSKNPMYQTQKYIF